MSIKSDDTTFAINSMKYTIIASMYFTQPLRNAQNVTLVLIRSFSSPTLIFLTRAKEPNLA